MSEVLKVRFWGVRGSIPSCLPDTSRYGGDTACIEISCGDEMIVIDGGSGVMHLGRDVAERGIKDLDLFVTHYHFDHLCGLPFFCRGYSPDMSIRARGPVLDNGVTLQSALSKLMEPPLFPVTTTMLRGVTFSDFNIGDTTELATGASVKSIRLNHPGGACGYRIDWKGRSIAIVTDFEHEANGLGDELISFVQGADLMVYDAMYTAADYPNFVGWGHSTDVCCMELARVANVKQSVLFHHAAYRTDDELDQVSERVASDPQDVIVGYTGLVVELPV